MYTFQILAIHVAADLDVAALCQVIVLDASLMSGVWLGYSG